MGTDILVPRLPAHDHVRRLRAAAHRNKAPKALIAALIAALIGLLFLAPRTYAGQFIVTNVNDVGGGSLRQALTDANGSAGTDTIAFNIPGPGPHTIAPLSGLPTITDPVLIDGYTQSGAVANTNSVDDGLNTTLAIFLNGTNVPAGNSGLYITGGSSTIKGLAIGNFGAGPDLAAILIETGGGNVIQGCFIGTDIGGTLPQQNANHGILIRNSSNNLIGGLDPADRNLISGNNDAGVMITGTLASNNAVQGNLIGPDVTGTVLLTSWTGATGNLGSGVRIDGAPNNLVGGAAAGARNIISGNRFASLNGIGVEVTGSDADGNQILGNYIGTDVTGRAALGNRYFGILLSNAAPNTVIGAPGAGNVISATGLNDGIRLGNYDAGSVVQANRIGTTAQGDSVLGNEEAGIFVLGARYAVIGGEGAGEGNLISGNTYGIRCEGAFNEMKGNYIGTDVTGMIGLPNQTGIRVAGEGNVIGGAAAGAGNLISGNGRGINITNDATVGTIVQGNLIGTATDGVSPLGNAGYGVLITGSPGQTTVGGLDLGNVIAFNGLTGVEIGANSVGNLISCNSIHSNAPGTLYPDINLEPNIGVTPNDSADVDTGGNQLQNFPDLSAAAASPDSLYVSGMLHSAPSSDFALEFFANSECDSVGYGAGETFIGQHLVSTDALGNASFDVVFAAAVNPGSFITSTATDTANNTSEFSACVEALALPQRLYVDQSATGARDGTSWTDAYVELRDALDLALRYNAISEIWVAQGTYFPTAGTDTMSTFEIRSGLEVYGGFAGWETVRQERSVANNPTILSGEIGDPGIQDNCLHVVSMNDVDATTVLDGFRVTKGYARGLGNNRYGGGLLILTGSPQITRMTFIENTAGLGGGVLVTWGAPSFSKTRFYSNSAESGGGLYSVVAISVNHCWFENNTAANDGGGLYLDTGFTSSVRDATFSSNTAGRGGAIFTGSGITSYEDLVIAMNTASIEGGGVYVYGGAPTLANVLFYQNVSDVGGGISIIDAAAALTNVTFYGNQAATSGGAISHNQNSDTNVDNCVLWGDSAATGPEVFKAGSGPVFSYSLIEGSGGSGGSWDLGLGTDGGNNIDADPFFRDPVGGDLRLWSSSPALDAGNSAVIPATVLNDLDGNPRIAGVSVDMGPYEYQGTPTDIPDDPSEDLPGVISLRAAYPNPFNPTIAVEFELDRGRNVRIDVFDVTGRLVRTLVNETRAPGAYRIYWHGQDDSGHPVATGVYFLSMRSEGWGDRRKIVLIK